MVAVSLVIVLTFLGAICQHMANGFVPLRSSKPISRRYRSAEGRTASSSSALFYTDEPPRQPQQRPLTIPVLGPIPGGKPLMVGEDYILNHPTPMQWNVLEESMQAHQKYLKKEEGAAGIDAAPLVAYMDETTSLAPLSGDKKNSKYATIAAVVGISSTAQKSGDLDTSSNEGFMESIMRVFQPDSSAIRPSESTIRLVGIGRAALFDFHSKLPSIYYESRDDGSQYHALDNENRDEVETPIVMAQFRLMSDTSVRSASFVNHFDRSGNSSPIHALAEMSSLSHRITSLHEDRKQLVRGLQAAKARLAVASKANVLQDHDGLGQLSSGFNVATGASQPQLTPQEKVQQDIYALLNEFPANSPENILSPRRNTDSRARLLEMENYGMGISSSSFSAIPGLTTALADKLQPYYSPETRETEEHYYEVFSFMGVLSLSKFVKAQDLDWAMKCTNTIERMQWVYEWMWSHKKLLREASEEVSNELRDCGEECTDLW